MFALLDSFWYVFLYQPLFNALIFIYSTIAQMNLGWAVVWLTIFLRILLLPLNIISERNNIRHERANAEARAVQRAYKNDRIAAVAETRKIMRKYKISPWAKVVMLGVQILVLVLLYQVFIHGISGERLIKTLYTWIDVPGSINTNFYGFDIGRRHDSLWAGIAAFYLFFSIFRESRESESNKKPDLLYWVGFPLATFAILWYLPMVKSLFILTTMLFSDSITIIRKVLFGAKKADSHASAGHH